MYTHTHTGTHTHTYTHTHTHRHTHTPASVDADREEVVVEALGHEVGHLRVRGDLLPLQTLQTE